MKKTIEVTISQNGTIKLMTKGFVRAECLEASRFLESALGKTVDDRVTSEYHDIKARDRSHMHPQHKFSSGS